MAEKELNHQKLQDYWIGSSDEDYETMLVLFNNRKYSWSLFIGHLLIEKLLKALYVKQTATYPPLIHNLLRIVESCDVELTKDQKLFFATVTAFNINARYDDYKMSFQKQCTPEFTLYWIEEIKSYRTWIKQVISQ